VFCDVAAHIIAAEFDKNVGTFQHDKDEQTAMDLKFSLYSDYERDQSDCYRHLSIRLFAEGNYVTVMLREDAVRAPEGDVDTGWLLVADHDSCWRDGLQNVLRTYERSISHMDTLFQKDGWYTKHLMTEEEIKAARALVKACYSDKEERHVNWEPWISRLPLAEVKDLTEAP